VRPPRPARPPRPPGRDRRRRDVDVVLGLPGLTYLYRNPTVGGWPEEIAGVVNGVHTGDPSIATDPPGVIYDGATQWTTLGTASTFNYQHQTQVFSQSLFFEWAGPAEADALEVVAGNALGAATKGTSVFVDDDFSELGDRMLSAQIVRGVAPQIVRLNTDPNAVTVGQIHHALLTCDGVTARLAFDGVEVDSAAALAVATGNATHAMRLGDTQVATPTFALNGIVYEAAFGTEDWSAYAEQIYSQGPGGFG
jgi:hypothetical protein